MEEFKSFYETVGGGEGNKCHYPTRLDTYGCGCQHNCKYCYAKSLLSFRKMWNAKEPAVADIEKIRKTIKTIPQGSIVRLGGMTDCFQPLEKEIRNTYNTIKALNEQGVGYLIVTKSSMVADDEYMKIYDKKLCHIQITVTCTSDELYKKLDYERASLPSERLKAIKKLQKAGFDVAIRLSPLIEDYVDFSFINKQGIKKAIVEFLRVNAWIKKWFKADYSKYKLKEGGYSHLPMREKQRMIARLNIPEISVCEDYSPHYKWWTEHYNPNKEDCCNLRKEKVNEN